MKIKVSQSILEKRTTITKYTRCAWERGKLHVLFPTHSQDWSTIFTIVKREEVTLQLELNVHSIYYHIII